MKKVLLLFTIIVAFSGYVIAQESESISGGGKFFIGVKGSYGIIDFESILASEPDFADITFDNASCGLILGFNITGKLGLQAEGNFSRYTAGNIIPTYVYSLHSPVLQPYGEMSQVDHVNLELYYADVPLIFKYTFSEIGFSPYIYAGANWGINILGNAKIVREISEVESIYRTYRDDITDRIVYYEFAPIAGAGARMNFGSLSLFGDLRYKHGLMNLSNVDNKLGYTNRALWISIGLVFNL